MKQTIRLNENDLRKLVMEALSALTEGREELLGPMKTIRTGIVNLKKELNNVCRSIVNEPNFKVMNSQHNGSDIQWLKEYRDNIFQNLDGIWDSYYSVCGYATADRASEQNRDPFSNDEQETYLNQAMNYNPIQDNQ